MPGGNEDTDPGSICLLIPDGPHGELRQDSLWHHRPIRTCARSRGFVGRRELQAPSSRP